MIKLIRSSLLVCFMAALIFSACQKMDTQHKGFIVQGGITYTGKATSPVAFAGHNRVMISWLRGADPNVDKARIFWNNYTDSVEITIPATGDTINVLIENLLERNYSFFIKTYDTKGNTSLPVELLSAAFGEKYQASLRDPSVTNFFGEQDNSALIQWSAPDLTNGAYANEVAYTNLSGDQYIQRFPIEEAQSTISDIKSGTTFQYRTLYLPDTLSIDTFFTDYANAGRFMLNKKIWKIVNFSTQHLGDANLATNFFDGKVDTRWHTNANTSAYPHHITVDMGVEKQISQFELFKVPADVRGCNQFQFLVSEDNVNWHDLGIFNFNHLLDGAQVYDLASKPKARYFKFIGISGPQKYMVMAEINIYADTM